MPVDSCPACGSTNVREVTEDYRSPFGTVTIGAVHTHCNDCGFDGVNGEQMDRNAACERIEIEGPHKPIAIDSLHHANVYFDWSWKGCGFGQLSFSLDKGTGKLTCMNECMSRESVRKLLHALADHIADNVELEDEH